MRIILGSESGIETNIPGIFMNASEIKIAENAIYVPQYQKITTNLSN